MTLASISGVALTPGMSRNRRLYTPEIIAKAAARMQERLADPAGLPIVMRTHHEAGDDSAKIVGRVKSVKVDNNKALRYEADLYDTFHGQEIASLVTPEQPALRSVSIHGYWIGDTRQVQTAEGLATTADDLEIDAIDFTASPGVDGALIDGGSKKATESGGVLRTPISEAMEASVTLTEEGSGWADITPDVKEGVSMTRGVQYEGDLKEYWVQEAKYSADDMKSMVSKGQAMKNASGEPSYPIADISDLKKAIRAVGRGKAGHDAIRKHIIARAKALKATSLIPDNWNSDGSMKESSVKLGEITEYYGDMDSGGGAGFCIDAYAGPLSVTVRGCVSPDELRFVAQRAAQAALDTILTMDPDQDGDLADADDFDSNGNFIGDQMESAVKGGALTESQVRQMLAAEINKLRESLPPLEQWRKELGEAQAVNGVKGKPADEQGTAPAAGNVGDDDGGGGVSPDDDMESMMSAAPAGAHGHTHGMGEDSSHTHGHVHTHETAGGGSYDHSHGHTHFHLPGASEAHVHTHDHDHATAPADTHESHVEEESAVSETNQAAEAAPARILTEEDVKIIGGLLAEAVRAIGEQKEAKHAAPTQETSEAAEQVAETVQTDVTEKAPDLSALKESLAQELRKELRDELRSEFLKENGLPPRRGYRLNENAEEEVQLTDKELFDKHRVELLLGAYAKTPSPNAS